MLLSDYTKLLEYAAGGLTVEDEADDDWHQDEANNHQTCHNQRKPTTGWSKLFILYKNRKKMFILMIE